MFVRRRPMVAPTTFLMRLNYYKTINKLDSRKYRNARYCLGNKFNKQ